MLRRFYTTFLFAVLSIGLFAVPAERIRRLLTLVDGSQVMATLYGNENYSYYLTDDDYVIVETENGFEYGQIPSEEELNLRLKKALPPAQKLLGSQSNAAIKSKGVQHIPVVLVSFSDKDFSVAEGDDAVREYYRHFCNGSLDGNRYTDHGSYGSVRDYFVEQSDSVFFPLFTVIGPVHLPSSYATYGKNGAGSSKDIYFNTFRNEALKGAMKEMNDWSIFDNDQNGTIDMVFFVYAGMGENNGDDPNLIWPKEWSYETNIEINGKTQIFSTCAATPECRPEDWDDEGNVLGTKGDGIGVFIHELSHSIGLPDFYDTNYRAFGMDIWSVMDYGEYCNGSYTPVNYTAYERDFMGWRPLVQLDEPCTLRIPCFAKGGMGYKVVNKYCEDEYYVLENRQTYGWDEVLCKKGHGLQVTHVDYLKNRWSANTVNSDYNHQRMTIIAANDCYMGTNATTDSNVWVECLKGNLYPGTNLNYSLTDDTYPAAKVFNGSYMHKPIYDITEEEDGTVTLKFMPYGTLNAPTEIAVDLPNEDADEGNVDYLVKWNSVVDAECYRLRLYKDEELVYEKDSLYETNFDLQGLDLDEDYTVMVCAMSDTYRNSEFVQCDFHTTASGIESILPESLNKVRVYALDGRFVTECFADEIHRLGLHSGVYVLKDKKYNTKKVFIK